MLISLILVSGKEGHYRNSKTQAVCFFYHKIMTWCVDVSWELCEREDLLDIVKVYIIFAINTNLGGLIYV